MVDTRTKTGKAALVAVLAAIVIGVLALIGWFFKIEILKSGLHGTVTMNPVTALAMILAGISLALSLRVQDRQDQDSGVQFLLAARVCALVVALIGFMRLVAIFSGLDIGVDQWLFPLQVSNQLPFPSRMAPNGALNFFLLGSALLLVNVKNRSVRFCVEFSVAVVGFESLLSVLGYIYDIESFYRLGDFIPMALPAAIAFSLLTAAFLLSHTDNGLLAVFAGDSAVGKMARRLLPAAILVPAVLGWLSLQGDEAGIYRGKSGEAAEAVGNILVFTFLVCWSVKWLFSADLGRKKAEETLHESEEKFRQLAENISDVFWMTSPDLGKVHYISPAYEQVWGRSVDSVYTKPYEWGEAILPEDRERVLTTFSRFGDEASVSAEYRISRPDGTVRWIFSRGFQVRDTAGQVIRIAGVATDITERKEALMSLMESQQRLALARESAHIGIWDWDVAADKLVWDTQMYELYGIREQDFSGAYDAWQKGLHPEDRERGDAAIHAALDGVKDFHIEFRVVWPDGTVRNIEARAEVHRASDGSATRMIGVNWDITARKRLEGQLLQSQKMETVGKLAGGIAHEFNSILTAIMGQSELLLADLPSESPLAKNAIEISKAAGRAATLTRQLLAYGRKQLLQPETINLNQIVTGMEGMFHHLMGDTVDTQIIPASDLHAVKADAGQIEQVIMNMAINARDAMPNGGKLTLETANVSFDQESVGRYPELRPGDYAMLAITDTGTGMSEKVKARLFEPFFSTKGVGQGTGLGLSTCYGIIKQSGGHISVYSELSRGTTFKIYLPQVEQQTKIPIERLASPDLPRGTETILLVEDDPALREMAAILLKRLGYTVLTAANGIEALNVKQQRDIGHIDLLFTDVVMPHMSGKELADRVRALYPHTRILFTSAYTENAIVHQGVLDKGVALLQKPFTPAALARKIREVLDVENVSSKAVRTAALKDALESSNKESVVLE